MLALGVAVEGCSEFMTPLMNHVWPLIEAGLNDSDATVRKASCVAVSCLCEWLEDECINKHSLLVPVSIMVIHLFGDELTPHHTDHHATCERSCHTEERSDGT